MFVRSLTDLVSRSSAPAAPSFDIHAHFPNLKERVDTLVVKSFLYQRSVRVKVMRALPTAHLHERFVALMPVEGDETLSLQLLFHGTNAANLSSIIRSGLVIPGRG